ncbi:MAG: FAD-dependent oxidoreductase [Gammaproteobacteria bacterium]|nr:FAD-dependent oxidoreductase [Gammaproteobacteria bacterium]
MADYKYLFRPLPIGTKVLKNRLIMGPHVSNYWPNHLADEHTVAYYEERAAGGVGMIIIGASSVDGDADYSPFIQCATWSDDCIPGLRAIGEAVHRHDTLLLKQLVHPGIHQLPEHDPRHVPGVAPSVQTAVEEPFFHARALEIDEIHAIEDKFADASERIQKAGLDGVEIHGAHGYLLGAFLTPLKNRREDEYGGSLENRIRFLLATIDKVRRRVGPDFIVGVRLSTSDMVEGGMEPHDVAEVVKLLEATGQLDYIHCSIGLYRTIHYIIPSHYSGLEPGYQAEFTAQVKAAVQKLPVFLTGRINDPMLADRMIADGVADACVLVRELIAEPEFPNKAKQGRIDEIRPCAYWNQGCAAHIFYGLRVECQMNGAAGHELEFGRKQFKPAARPKHILVVGGGPAGLEFSRIAASRGHRITLHERGTELGGQLAQFARLPGRAEVRNWLDWLVRQVDGKPGVDVKLGAEIRADNLAAVLAGAEFDEVVVASGARAAADGRSSVTIQPLPGHEQAHVLTYEDFLCGGGVPAAVGKRVVIVDELADRIAPGLAEMLVAAKREVEIITRWPSVGHEQLFKWLEMPFVVENLDNLGVRCTPNTWLKTIGQGTATAFNIYSGREWEVEADTVVLVTMKYSNNEILQSLKAGSKVPVHSLGDAIAPRQVADAVADATRLAHSL